MQDYIQELARDIPLRIQRHEFISASVEDIIAKTQIYTKESDFDIEIIERSTCAGFYMNLHRDDYRFNSNAYKADIRGDSLWIPIYATRRPKYTVVWYQSTQGIDFVGGNLRFFDGYTVKPSKNVAILFDSNDMHEVTLQQTKHGLSDERKVTIIKFY